MPLGAEPGSHAPPAGTALSTEVRLRCSCVLSRGTCHRPLAVSITDHLVRESPVFYTGKWPMTGVRLLGLQ